MTVSPSRSNVRLAPTWVNSFFKTQFRERKLHDSFPRMRASMFFFFFRRCATIVGNYFGTRTKSRYVDRCCKYFYFSRSKKR